LNAVIISPALSGSDARKESITVKAAYYETTGGPEVIQYGERPKPHPGDREALIRVGAAALNPIDTYIRSGAITMPLPFPYIPGCDLAGTIEAVGAGVKSFKVGDRVWCSNQGVAGRQGTFAEYASVSEEWLYPTPENVTDAQAAAAALVGITAHLGLFRWAKLEVGETVFVHGGTGGVGSMVVQMAKAVGAKVITTVGDEAKAAICRQWGADLVLNYKTDDIPARVRDFTRGKGVQVWYETQREPNFTQTFELLCQRGRMILMAGRQAQPTFPVGAFYPKELALFGFVMFAASSDEQRRCAEDINRWHAEKQLQVLIGRTFRLAETADAHRLQEDCTLHKKGSLAGKIVLVP
jgi:NADPH2:quinone reductase